MSKARSYLPQGSGFYLAVASASDITNFGWSLADGKSTRVVVRFLRGKKMTTVEELHNEVAAALQFPWYYGENWPAFDECINDLDWLAADSYILIVTDAEEVLSKEDEQFSVFIKTLQQAVDEWSCAAERPDELRRSANFHIVFQASEDKSDEVSSRLKSTGALFQYLNLQTS